MGTITDTGTSCNIFITHLCIFPGVLVADKCPIVLGKEGARILAVECPELGEEGAASALAERPSLALLLKKTPEKEGDVIGSYLVILTVRIA